jgi:hypothetical protein
MADIKALAIARRLAEERLIKFGLTPAHEAEVERAIAAEEAEMSKGISAEQMKAVAEADGIARITVAKETTCGCACCTPPSLLQ